LTIKHWYLYKYSNITNIDQIEASNSGFGDGHQLQWKQWNQGGGAQVPDEANSSKNGDSWDMVIDIYIYITSKNWK
jgi:hypothetical protein